MRRKPPILRQRWQGGKTRISASTPPRLARKVALRQSIEGKIGFEALGIRTPNPGSEYASGHKPNPAPGGRATRKNPVKECHIKGLR
ncbi:MAG: hypothetical protein M2R45_01447 [Verrucomicrobia subdivision 3 bacterium]|nr:hypothetical protein [Limisphaerales bacterium]MCS1417608.1 hypothetical protein [Limisphaerales bacterium]